MYFFNGRLWITPATMSVIDDSGMANRNLTVGNVVAYIGRAEGGEPNKALKFGSPSEARAVLRSGDLLKAVEKAFDPSAQTGAPSVVVAVRVDPATQSALTLKDAALNNVITLASTDYGAYTSQIKAKVESATTKGKKLTTQFGTSYYSEDNVYRDAFSILYTGAELTALMSITNAQLTLEAPAATVVATIDLNVYDTIQELVDRINTVAGFAATVLDSNGEKSSLNGLDSVTGQDVKTALYTATANLQAVVDWFNGATEGYVTATRVAGAGAVPSNVAFTYLAGGSNGTVTNTEWTNAFTTLQAEDVQWVVPLSSDASIHAMNDAHVAYMSNVARMERRGLVGGASAQTQTEVKAAAKALNSDRTSQCYPGYWDYNAAGTLELRPSYMTAALVAAAFAGSNPGTALTNKSLKIRGLEAKLRNPTDTDDLIKAGILCIEETSNGYKVVKSISTWLINRNYNRVEVSVGVAVDFTARNLRDALDVLRGEKGTPATMGRAYSLAHSALMRLSQPEPAGPGVLVGDEANPPFKNLRVFLEGDVLAVEVEASPVIPVNYIPLTIHAVPFSAAA